MKKNLIFAGALALMACGSSGYYLTPYKDDSGVFDRFARGAAKEGCTREKGEAFDFFRCKDNVVVSIVGSEGHKFGSCKGLDDAACKALIDSFYTNGGE